jgi:flagellar biosynthesis/type III secretory pathway protein FliH
MLSEKIKELMGEIDRLDEVASLMEQADSLEGQLSTAEASIADLTAENEQLRKVNQDLLNKIALSATDEVVEEEVEEKTPDEVLDELFS